MLCIAEASAFALRYGVAVSPSDVLAFMDTPLSLLGLDAFVFFAPGPGSVAAGQGELVRTLPFDLSGNADAASFVGQQMLTRLLTDYEGSAGHYGTHTIQQLHGA